MAKKITDENGNTYVQKKPFYKRVWFWILAVLLVIIIASALGGKDVKKVDNDGKTSATLSKTTFKVGETAEYDGVQYKVNSVEFKDGDQYVHPDQGKKWVVVNVTITNKGEDKVSYNPFDFKLDDNGNQTNLTEIASGTDNMLNSGDLAKGASVTGNMVGQANQSDKLKLIYSGNMFSKKETVTFALN